MSTVSSRAHGSKQALLLVQGPEVLYAGIFLDAAECQKIMAAAPPAFSNITADHVTLCYRPSTEWLYSLPLGAVESLTISYEACRDGVQVACCDSFLLISADL